MKRLFSLALFGMLTLTEANAQMGNVPMEEGRYESNWKSLSEWECPEWYKDAKFGLWAHWGPQCQAESGDWYARFMYYSDSPYDQHRGIHYNPAEYGLKEFCRDFVAKKWNPEAIMKRYADVGCKFFMALGNHHDNFDLWDSPYQEWNSVNMGPKRDVVGEWEKAARSNNLRFGVSIHASHAWTWLEPSQKYDGNLTKADGQGKWWEGYDPQELYAQQHPHSTGWEQSGTIHSQWDWGNGASLPSEAYKTKLQNRCRQVVNDYNPDIVYFDDTVLPFWGCDEQWGLDFLAHYYNHAANLNGGKADVVVTGKILPEEQKKALMWDVERGIPDRPQKDYWQTCTCIGQWHYQKNLGGYKSAATVVRMLVDVVSKNGNLLLSIPLNADGEYDAREAVVLDGIEAWMKINGESVYGTRYWPECFGEGPLAEATNGMTAQGFNEGQNYTSADVRYVTKGDTIYATIMAWPQAGDYTLKAFSPLASSYRGKVKSVTLLGYGEVEFRHGAEGLVVNIPSQHPNEIAPALRITFDDTEADTPELLQSVITTLEEQCKAMELHMSPVSTGCYNTQQVEALREAVSAAKQTDTGNAEGLKQAFETLRSAYKTFEANAINKGGKFEGLVAKNMTSNVLAEGENFAGTLGGRYGKLDNWTVENYSIDKGSDGKREGLDNYGGVRGISLGVWDDKQLCKGDLKNARIYRKVTLKPGTYYFGAAYNSLYHCNEQAYLFVAKELLSTADIPSKSLACYQVNQGKEGSDLYGLYIKVDKKTDFYLGWQANLDNGSSQQEFRATKVVFYEVADKDASSISDKLANGGWSKLEDMSASFDLVRHCYVFVDHTTGLPLAARSAEGSRNWAGTYVMQYDQDADPNRDAAAVWTIDAYTAEGTPAVGQEAERLILSTLAEPDRHFRTEEWSKVVWQTYSDFGKNGYPNDGRRDIAYLIPEYSAEEGWTFRNPVSGQYIGPWVDGAFEQGAEFAANKKAEQAAHLDIYTLPRTQWMMQREDLSEATEDAAVDISYMITNNSFERYDENRQPLGWTLQGGGEVERGYLTGCKGQLYMNNWQGSGQLSNRSIEQTISQLPAGRYRLSVYSMCVGEGAQLFATHVGGTESQDLKHSGTDYVSLCFDMAEPSDLTVGVRLEGYTTNNLKYDNFQLHYLGAATTTGIDEATLSTATQSQQPVFDLQGRRLSRPHKGICIVAGKKVVK